MDLLLRRHARRNVTFASGAGEAGADRTETTSVGPHMDADEMNAYAEGLVPAETRTRYVEHLAGCDRCRAIVTDLALAANVPVRDEEQVAQTPVTPRSSWREWLAALFAPPLIRYGAAALALVCVAGVVFLALRQQKTPGQQEAPTLVAQNKESDPSRASAVKPDATQTPVTEASPAVVPGAEPAQAKESTANQAGTIASSQNENKAEQANAPQNFGTTRSDAPVEAPAAPRPSSEVAPQRSASEPRDMDTMARTAPAAPPPLAASPGGSAGGAPEQTAADRQSRNRTNNGVTRDERAPQSGAMSNTATVKETEEVVTLGRQSAPATEARRKSARRGEAMREGADSNSRPSAGARASETRSVGGRQFRREGGAWIDTAYSQGRATVNVSRGSEQYRALVADEPGLRSIAEQLGGELIVVWKGRAYRIH
ncbi:MAG TPA: zf-HC2 domain-containing protein [Pyrinomonadaceae bacterium]|jgi:hypothetical protein